MKEGVIIKIELLGYDREWEIGRWLGIRIIIYVEKLKKREVIIIELKFIFEFFGS